ncbi:MAG: VOC family protein [Thermoanaerobaculia bacterium]
MNPRRLLTRLLLVVCLTTAANARPHHIDHVGVGMNDLDEATRRVTEATGIAPVAGGEHPGAGTRNSLLSLGDRQYLEIIAPQPGADLGGWLSNDELQPVLWAVASDDVEATRALLAEAGFTTSDPRPGSRRTPDGALLEWRTFAVTDPEIPVAPFFIHWSEETPHPATTSPGGCSLASFSVSGPDLDAFRRLAGVLELHVEAVDAPAPALHLTLACPDGEVTW